MPDQTTDPIIDAPAAPASPVEDESIFPTVHTQTSLAEPTASLATEEKETISTEPVAVTSPHDDAISNDDKMLVQTLSDNGIATLQEVKKLFERVQTLEEDNRKLHEIISSKNIEIKDLTAQTIKVDDLEVHVGELKKKLDAQYLIIQKVRQEASKNMFTKGYTIPEDVLSMVKESTR